MSLNLCHGAIATPDGLHENRWPGIAELIRANRPGIVAFEETRGWAANGRRQQARAEMDLGMRVHLTPGAPPSMGTAIGHRHDLPWILNEDAYAARTLNGFTHVVFSTPAGPLTVISAHLNPTSAAAAAVEAQLMISRLYRHGRLGLLIGDVNHVPINGEGNLDWDSVHPYNRSARTVIGEKPLRGDRQVASALAQGSLTDVALHLSGGDPASPQLAPTGHGGLRVDQAHVTPALLPAVTGLRVISTRPPAPAAPLSDHDALLVDLDLSSIDS